MAAGQFGSVNDALLSFQSKPLGLEAGDPTSSMVLNRNESADYIKCFVRNWSAQRPRKYISEVISWRSGGNRAALAAKKAGEDDFNLGHKRAEAYANQDPSIITEGVLPQKAILLFDNKRFEIPYTVDVKKEPEPEWIPIPQGLMDLYHGNPDRLESLDSRERTTELESLAYRRKKDYCVRNNRAGVNQNPFGYLEFKREIIMPQALAIDSEHVYSDEYVEV